MLHLVLPALALNCETQNRPIWMLIPRDTGLSFSDLTTDMTITCEESPHKQCQPLYFHRASLSKALQRISSHIMTPVETHVSWVCLRAPGLRLRQRLTFTMNP